MLDVRRMRVLREVAQRGSFSAAAESLSFTQSAVSQQIAALEREAGTTLVERGARGIRLTDAGRALVVHTDAIVARLDAAEAELAAIAGLQGGRLRMAAFESAGSSLMPPAIARFRNHHPAVELSLALAEPEPAVAMLRSGELELALLFDAPGGVRTEARWEGVEVRHLLDDPMYLVLAADHPLADKPDIGLVDVADDAWVEGAPDCECNRLLHRACEERGGFRPRIAFQSDDYLATQGFVAAGVGVALVPDLGLTTIRKDIVVRELGDDAPVRRIWAATLAGGYRSPATSAMLGVLVDVAERYVETRVTPAAALV